MKSIYEEALKELTWLVRDEFDENPKRSRLNVSQRLDMFKKVKDTLEQARKQEKLLELYRYLNENTNDYDLHYEKVDEIDNKIEELEKQIKELENDNWNITKTNLKHSKMEYW